MKIAYQFYGHLRTFADNPTIVKNLLEHNPPGDLFVHTYATKNATNELWHNDRAGSDVRVMSSDIDKLLGMYPEIIGIDVDEKTGGHEAMEPEFSKVGFRYSMNMVNKLRTLSERKYDAVFLGRFDLWFAEPLALTRPKPGILYGSHNLNAVARGVDGDVFLYGTPDVMTAIVDPMIPESQRALIPGYGFVGEMLNTAIRKANGFEYEAIKSKLGILRSTGVMWLQQ